MSSDTTFLNIPYGGYLHRNVPKEVVELTHVGPGTPCGEYFRRFWHPVATSDELGDLPLPLCIFGEEPGLYAVFSESVAEFACESSVGFAVADECGLQHAEQLLGVNRAGTVDHVRCENFGHAGFN